jgi:hypothetical protein
MGKGPEREISHYQHGGRGFEEREPDTHGDAWASITQDLADALLDDKVREAEEKVVPPEGTKNPYGLTLSIAVSQYLRDRESGAFAGDPSKELYVLGQILDAGGLGKGEYNLIYRRWLRVRSQVNNPTPEQRERGYKPKRASLSEGPIDTEEGIAIRSVVDDILATMIDGSYMDDLDGINDDADDGHNGP